MKSDLKKQQRTEILKGQPIKEIIDMQNMPQPVDCWKESKIMSPVYYFLFNTGDQKKTVANQTVTDLKF